MMQDHAFKSQYGQVWSVKFDEDYQKLKPT